jgi:hypothetical protein
MCDYMGDEYEAATVISEEKAPSLMAEPIRVARPRRN